jgi:DNA-binding response OmpR family regulator
MDIRPKLLIVEDDEENQKLLQYFLKRKFEVTLCDSAEQFSERLLNDRFDIFLIDISLKGEKDGIELIKNLRASDNYKDAPIICISAHVFPKDRENAFKAGVDEFLPRPIYNNSLLASLIEVYERKTGSNKNK